MASQHDDAGAPASGLCWGLTMGLGGWAATLVMHVVASGVLTTVVDLPPASATTGVGRANPA